MKVTAKVQLTVEVSLMQPWQGNETFERIHRAASREANEILNEALQKAGVIRSAYVAIIGAPKVSTVTVEQ